MTNLMRFGLTRLLAVLCFLLFSAGAIAADSGEGEYRDFSSKTPSATIDFELQSLKLLAGVTWGKGVLHYQGQDYPLKIASLAVGGVGYKEIKGNADVHDLDSLEDLPGIYGGGSAGATLGRAGAQKAVLENGEGVVLILGATDSTGAQLALSLGGLEIKYAD